ncbi:hypothetical protein ACF3MZ_30620 [Paenibacillaceae bacterium WGS1546]|uniref:hypothetical protein n=1 Tax=Cohnella sp. WGS1546 TaxID=3366810 RepID=UPI00372D47C9
MSGRNNEPDNDGPAGSPDRLDQFGKRLASDNEEEFQAAVEQACEAAEEPDH